MPWSGSQERMIWTRLRSSRRLPLPPQPGSKRRTPGAALNRPPVLPFERSADLLERLLGELSAQEENDGLIAWAKASLPLKNTLREADARTLEAAYQARLDYAPLQINNDQSRASLRTTSGTGQPFEAESGQVDAATETPLQQPALAFPKEPPRRRNKDHLAFVRSQGCLVCQRTPADAHHLKFAQPRTLGRKVSDEFTVPLCRSHHQALHRESDEKAWWANLQITPLSIAKQLWDTSPVHLAEWKSP